MGKSGDWGLWMLVLFSCLLWACRESDTHIGRSLDLPYGRFRDGDLAFRRGGGLTSRAVLAADAGGVYSHVGLLKREGDEWFVIHAVPGEPVDATDVDRVKCEPVDRFFAADRAVCGAVMRVKDFPFLASMKGETLITTDGSTLLGADDKAGVAEIMTAVETLQQSGAPHGKLCIAFTPDEEIGEGASLFDLERFGAAFAYTVDGGDVGGIEYENFNAASATVTVRGLSVHTGSAKNTMVNAANVAMEFHLSLPHMARPETTEGREGFYHLCLMTGDVTEA